MPPKSWIESSLWKMYMKYCSSCLSTNLRPNAKFLNGQCIACRYSNEDVLTNSNLKLRMLKERIKNAKYNIKKTGPYDCIVGVSGGKDSTRQAHWVRDRLKLRPLLICAAYPPKQMSKLGSDNLSNLVSMGFDLLVATPAPQTSKQLTLKSFTTFGNVCKSTEISLFSTVPRLAINMDINLIFWGENPALQVGDSAVLGDDAFDGNNLRNLNTLTEGGIKWISSVVDKTYKADHYYYPDEIDFRKKKISIFYLGAAWDDWGLENNSAYAALQGLNLRVGDEDQTGDLSNASMLDEEFTNINMMLKYYKFGFGRATDLLNEQIRSGQLTRIAAIQIAEKYDGVCSDKIIQSFCKYVDITEDEFWLIAKKWVNTSLFQVPKYGRPLPKFKVGYGIAR